MTPEPEASGREARAAGRPRDRDLGLNQWEWLGHNLAYLPERMDAGTNGIRVQRIVAVIVAMRWIISGPSAGCASKACARHGFGMKELRLGLSWHD